MATWLLVTSKGNIHFNGEAQMASTTTPTRKSTDARTEDRAEKGMDTSSTGTVNKEAGSATGMSSVGAELNDDATTFKEDGMVVLDAGGPYVTKAPAVTPAELVSYPATGGLPDTGPHSKYVIGEDVGVKLFNEDGERVDRDGVVIDEFGDRIVGTITDPARPEDAGHIPEAIKAEMDAGKKALSRA